ncbi:hypothetical protein ASD56_11395 [Microbacterium sp. Root166]|uniref:hypothetical protein n=1 Tax=Microbacterium sp. Root166 TaxID=1736478 RepID=UPI0006FAC387|nr:hypothetical protein [Microbacterium sp. Root166]KQZ84546.1 hypothetical protein ASD56_11395 [Microbacterium sp. Root166]
MSDGIVRFCRSRNGGRRCTRHLDHPGLHRHRAVMWADAAADAARCSGSGGSGSPALPLPDGYPNGRALCPLCLRFVALDADDRIAEHDTADPADTPDEARRRREWLNTNGW